MSSSKTGRELNPNTSPSDAHIVIVYPPTIGLPPIRTTISQLRTKILENLVFALSGLEDVTLTSPLAGQFLIYNGTEWINSTVQYNLDDIVDVVLTTPVSGQALTFNGTNWINATPATTLDSLTDVSITSPSANQALLYNGSIWTNQDIAQTLDGLTDVIITSPTNNQLLRYNGSNWINATQTYQYKYTKGASWANYGAAIVAADANTVYVHIPVSGTITKWILLADGGTGSCQLDLWKDTYNNYPPTIADSIVGSSKPNIPSSNKASDTVLNGWSPTVIAGDVIACKLESSTIFTYINFILEITVTL